MCAQGERSNPTLGTVAREAGERLVGMGPHQHEDYVAAAQDHVSAAMDEVNCTATHCQCTNTHVGKPDLQCTNTHVSKPDLVCVSCLVCVCG